MEGGFGISGLNGRFGISKATVHGNEVPITPVYMVFGIIDRNSSVPHERIVFISKPHELFWRLRWAIFRLRGVGRTLFSLKHIKEFRLYRVSNDRKSTKLIL